MKKIIFTLVCVMAAMTSLSAQDGAKNLSQGQWNHGLAIGAQWIATDLGFAQAESQVISRTNENYSLDDLKVMYGGRDKWVTYYDKLKKHENETGDLDKLIATIAAEYDKGAVIKNGVTRDINKYNASHTGEEVNTNPHDAAAITTDEAKDATAENAAPAAENADQPEAANKDAQDSIDDGNDSGHGLLYILTILGLALGAIGTFLAMQARKENQVTMRDNQDDIRNMQKQLDKMRAALKSGAVAVAAAPHAHNLDEKEGLAQTKKIEFDNRQPKKQEPKKEEPKRAEPKKEEPKRVETKKEEPKKEEPKKEESQAPAMGEPRILFMAKPDENDNFSRSSSQYEPGNSIFELTTMNGKSGSFTVINKAEAHKLALLMPGDTLTRACSGNNIQSTAGRSRIVTDRAGRAQLENGKWHIVVKAIIHYE